MNKPELLNWLREEYQKWEELLDEIGPVRMERPGVNGDWTMKDVAAHLTGWNHWLVARLQAAVRGEPQPAPPWPANLETDDEFNAWIYESSRGRSVGEILEEMQDVFQQLLTVIQGLPDDARVETIRGSEAREFYLVRLSEERFPAGEFFDHWHDDHEPDVRAWLARDAKGQERSNL